MFERFKNSLLYPKYLVNYRNDALGRVFIYVILFVVLLATRTIITSTTYDQISYGRRENIRQEVEMIDGCMIVDGILECDTEETQLFYADFIVNYYVESNSELNVQAYENQYNVVLFEDRVYLTSGQIPLFSISISDLPSNLQYINFDWMETDPDFFFDTLFDGVSDYLLETKHMWAPFMIIMDMLSSFMLFMIFILISAWMLKARFKVVRFKHLFVMTVYSSTALYVLLIINSLYSISIYIMILLVIVAVRQNSQLSLELHKRLNKKS